MRRTPIKASIDKRHIPFVVFDSEENIFEAVSEIAKHLLTAKFLIVSPKGGLRNKKSNEKISIINIRSDYQFLCDEDCLFPESLFLLEQLKNILENKITHSMNIAITSPMTMLRELFTVKGSGTFIKLGSEIKHINDVGSVDKTKLAHLLNAAFRKKIDPRFLDSKIDSLFLEVDYRGAAILKETEYGFLLSKFAVDEIARGEGIGRDIWNEMKKQHRTIFWRAKTENQINKWYAKECQGMDKGKDWYIYWINLEIEKIPSVCQRLQAICLSKEIEFLSFRNIPSSQLSKIHPTLTEEVMAANVQFIYNGLRYPGFFAVRKLTFHLKFYRYFFWILYLPLIPIIGILVMNYLKLRTGHGTKG